MVTESTSGPASGTRRAVANLAGASEFLPGLPSRGNFTVGFNSNMDAKTHMCLRDTSPPEGQIIKTDVTNILIRSLQLKRSDTVEQTTKGKRTPTRLLESKVPSKRLNTGASSSKQGSSSGFSDQTLQSLTVERLRALLKERGLSPKGRKDELILRLKSHDV
ncbi:SAP domain-containing protein [Rhynchospora pubera]|uniref:SAP domain-containing protein n=1 Tax=Rhynchospora pubera TaxID=906938 RepID=A0AAV8FVY3_9POAL|nr:SAP domain-containing protein [Rhynchospora pubera]